MEPMYCILKTQLDVLKEVRQDYPTSSIDNIIMQIESRINHIKSH